MACWPAAGQAEYRHIARSASNPATSHLPCLLTAACRPRSLLCPPLQAVLDEQLRLGAWAPTLSIAFPSSEAARAWAAGLARVDVRPGSLADTPAASALVAHAAAAALAGAGASAFKTIAAAQGHSGTPVQSCPPSPGRTEASAVGGKRKAEAAGLATPLVQVRALGGRWAAAAARGGAQVCSVQLRAPRMQPGSRPGSRTFAPPCLPAHPAHPPCPPLACPCLPQPRAFALITPSLTPTCSLDLA